MALLLALVFGEHSDTINEVVCNLGPVPSWEECVHNEYVNYMEWYCLVNLCTLLVCLCSVNNSLKLC